MALENLPSTNSKEMTFRQLVLSRAALFLVSFMRPKYWWAGLRAVWVMEIVNSQGHPWTGRPRAFPSQGCCGHSASRHLSLP